MSSMCVVLTQRLDISNLDDIELTRLGIDKEKEIVVEIWKRGTVGGLREINRMTFGVYVNQSCFAWIVERK